ncbi:MAG: SH3 domain-containing protein [Verrucomicrobia bacterium]|nr:SH3 domain-containing protein [Verrucomicrobiota bacterium]MBI3870977.1 SH3 domain-containing protein [Verrucomicrobiota bacterium]
MKTYSWFTFLLICCLSAGAAEAAEPGHNSKGKKTMSKPAASKSAGKTAGLTPAASSPTLESGPAEVTQEKVNVRSRPAADSEVVARLKSKDTVNILEEVTAKKAGPGEPSRWAKIAWPESASVWVFADFLDRSASTVKVAKLNLRSGPSENHSVVGVLEKGAAVKKLEAKGDWWKISPPETCVAYVAASLLAQKPQADKVAVVPPTPAPPIASAAPRRPITPPIPLARPLPPAPVPAPVPIGDNGLTVAPLSPPPSVTPPSPPPVVFRPAFTAPPSIARAPEPAKSSLPPPVLTREPGTLDIRPIPETAFVKRIVSREGRVRRAWSVQAPTPLVLENLHNGRVMNYLYSTSTNLNLGMFRGKVVTVTGEEALDERWPHIPVIRVESLQTPP